MHTALNLSVEETIFQDAYSFHFHDRGYTRGYTQTKRGQAYSPNPLISLERETGFEPATFSLGS